jgi:type IV pilus assembly protein PilA
MNTRNEKGFTLIELMIVIAIIGILAAIAIPQFSAYRARSYNAAAEADIRNLATAQEAYFVDNQGYCATSATIMKATWGFNKSNDVVVEIPTASVSSYCLRAYNTKGTVSYFLNGPGGVISHKP